MSASWDAAMRDVLAYVSSHGAVVVKNGEVQAPSVPVVVFDGRVVELQAVVAEYTRDTADRGLWNSSLEISKYRKAIVDSWLEAAREVAEGEGR